MRLEDFNISRETFQEYENLLRKWNNKINLVSKYTLDDFEQRHLIDSLQIIEYLNKEDKIIDLGSGAGMPGMILALIGCENITLIESDARKCAFLQAASKLIKDTKPPKIFNERIEEIGEIECDVITSRAFADLKTIFDITKKFHVKKKYLLHKGENYQTEIDEAKKVWDFEVLMHDSMTHKAAKILEITGLKERSA